MNVSPVPKPNSDKKGISSLRKIACTSMFSKVAEGFLKDWFLEDIGGSIDKSQYSGEKGTGTEHLLLKLVDRALGMLDENPDKTAVLAVGVDWEKAFDRIDPFVCASRFISMGLRPSLVPILLSYLSERTMTVKVNDTVSGVYELIAGAGQGTVLAQLAYNVANSSVANDVNPEDRFKYSDDLNFLELVKFSDKLTEYDVLKHVPSDVSLSQKFLEPSSAQAQTT